jgi:hypothetical protein
MKRSGHWALALIVTGFLALPATGMSRCDGIATRCGAPLAAPAAETRTALSEAGRQLDPAGRAHLERDQAAFDKLTAHGKTSGDFDAELLQSMRRDFLKSVRPPARTGQMHWANAAGSVSIQDASGAIQVRVSTAEPTVGRWMCEFDDSALRQAGVLIVGAASAALELGGPNEGWTLALRRQGDVLVIDELAPKGGGRRPFCNGGGSLAGVYFAVGSQATSEAGAALNGSGAK